jgi:hypothetical protein
VSNLISQVFLLIIKKVINNIYLFEIKKNIIKMLPKALKLMPPGPKEISKDSI